MNITVKGFLKYILIAIGVLFIIGILIPNDDKGKEESSSTKNDGLKTNMENVWTYSTSTDEMSGNVSFFAQSTSTDNVEFSFPYGHCDFTLIIRYANGKNEILLKGTSCQFMPGILGNEYLRIKIDDNEPYKVSYSDAADGSANVIFLSSVQKVLSGIKQGKELKIEAPFFQDGRKIINFHIENLEWEH